MTGAVKVKEAIKINTFIDFFPPTSPWCMVSYRLQTFKCLKRHCRKIWNLRTENVNDVPGCCSLYIEAPTV